MHLPRQVCFPVRGETAMISDAVHRVLQAINARELRTQVIFGRLATCPVRKHRRGATLVVGTDADGVVILECLAGCHREKIWRALGLEAADLFSAPQRESAAAFEVERQ